MRADSKEKKGDGSGAPTPISMFERADAVVREMARLLSSLSVSLSLSLSLSVRNARNELAARAREILCRFLSPSRKQRKKEKGKGEAQGLSRTRG